MTNTPQGQPIWYELITDAPDAAQQYYQAVMGWSFEKSPAAPGHDYRTFSAADGAPVGGMIKVPDGASLDPLWVAYFAVDDVDASAEKVTALGGGVHMAPQDIPGIGRIAFVTDPQGAAFYLMRGEESTKSESFAPRVPGHFCWNELVTSDQDAALDFYHALFGWEKSGAMPMGPDEEYRFIKGGEVDLGATMNRQEPATQPNWSFALTVADIDRAKAAVESAGGVVSAGPMELPTGDWLIMTSDAQGVKMAYSGPRVQEQG